MSEDPYVQSFYQNGVDHGASTNAGRWEAQNGYQPAPQQPNESASAYSNRLAGHAGASK
jgi:hypothetical protein